MLLKSISMWSLKAPVSNPAPVAASLKETTTILPPVPTEGPDRSKAQGTLNQQKAVPLGSFDRLRRARERRERWQQVKNGSRRSENLSVNTPGATTGVSARALDSTTTDRETPMHHRIIITAIRAVRSCRTLDQLLTAERYAALAARRIGLPQFRAACEEALNEAFHRIQAESRAGRIRANG